MWRFETYADSSGSWRWRLWANNNRKVATSGESFYSRSNAERAAAGFKANAKLCTYEVYADASSKYRWRAKRSSDIVASSGESFYSQSDAKRAAENVRDNAGGAAL